MRCEEEFWTPAAVPGLSAMKSGGMAPALQMQRSVRVSRATPPSSVSAPTVFQVSRAGDTKPASSGCSRRWPANISTTVSSAISRISSRSSRHLYNRAVDLLIVDDEASLRDFLTIVFEEEGWHVDAAATLAEGRA